MSSVSLESNKATLSNFIHHNLLSFLEVFGWIYYNILLSISNLYAINSHYPNPNSHVLIVFVLGSEELISARHWLCTNVTNWTCTLPQTYHKCKDQMLRDQWLTQMPGLDVTVADQNEAEMWSRCHQHSAWTLVPFKR